jgi:hypothetical protein
MLLLLLQRASLTSPFSKNQLLMLLQCSV